MRKRLHSWEIDHPGSNRYGAAEDPPDGPLGLMILGKSDRPGEPPHVLRFIWTESSGSVEEVDVPLDGELLNFLVTCCVITSEEHAHPSQ